MINVISVVLVMAGKGSRLKKGMNKVLLPLGEKLVFQHSLDTFKELGFEIICVVSEDDYENIKDLLVDVKYTFGGKTRQQSVYNGLLKASGDFIFIHDAARPFISREVILSIVSIISNDKAFLCFNNVKDTIKIDSPSCKKTLNREELIAVTTPQCASRDVFLDVHNKAIKDGYNSTDDMSLVEKYRPDIEINYVLSNEENFKITTPLDYELAKLIIEVKK